MSEQITIRPEVVELWVTALESGNYKQATGALKNDAGYCCLGVLAEAIGAKFEDFDLEVDSWREGLKNITKERPVLGGKNIANHEDENLSAEFKAFIGMSDELEQVFIECNDTHHLSFAQIAEKIKSGYIEEPQEDNVCEDEDESVGC